MLSLVSSGTNAPYLSRRSVSIYSSLLLLLYLYLSLELTKHILIIYICSFKRSKCPNSQITGNIISIDAFYPFPLPSLIFLLTPPISTLNLNSLKAICSNYSPKCKYFRNKCPFRNPTIGFYLVPDWIM